MVYVLIAIISYLIASIPVGLLVGKWGYGVDVREHGSGNIGATNVLRTLGPLPAILVLLGDAAKGALAVYLGRILLGNESGAVVGGLAALTGHNWSIFLRFKGGKGVATGLGVISMLNPLITLVCFLIWLVIVYFTRYVSLGSILAAGALPVLMFITSQPLEHLVFSMLAAAFVIYRHYSNIQRLLAGTENKIGQKK